MMLNREPWAFGKPEKDEYPLRVPCQEAEKVWGEEAGSRKGERGLFFPGVRRDRMKTAMSLTLVMGLAFGLALYPLEGEAMMGGGGGGMGGGLLSGFLSGMMGGGYSGMGPGGSQRMGPGSGQGIGPGTNFPGDVRQYGPQIQQPQKPLDKNEARGMAENYLKSTNNPNLHLGRSKTKEMPLKRMS
jgi:hypothetical protein